MDNATLMEDRISIKGKDGSEYFIYKFVKPRHFLCWRSVKNYSGYGELSLGKVDLTEFDPDILESNGVWKELGEDVKKAITDVKHDKESHFKSRMDSMRKCRKPKYPGLPREVECVQCHAMIKIVPSVLAKRIEKLNVLTDDYLKGFHCQNCRSTKGKKANVANAFKEIVCTKCGAKVMRPPAYILAYAKRKNLTVEEFAKVYCCQSCVPTRGRKKGSGKKNK